MWATCVELKLATGPNENLSLNESKIGGEFVFTFLNFFEVICFIWSLLFGYEGLNFLKTLAGRSGKAVTFCTMGS